MRKRPGFGLIDPHADLARAVLRSVPRDQIENVVFFDASDVANGYCFAFNPFECKGNMTDDEKELRADGLMVGFGHLFADSGEFVGRMSRVLRQAVRAAILSECPMTILDLRKFYLDEDFRKKVLDSITRGELIDYWTQEFPRLPNSAIDPILTRLGKFTDSPTVQRIVGQPTTAFDPFEIMNEGKYFIASLARGIIGFTPAAAFSSFLLSMFQLASLGRARIPEDERRLWALFLDEAAAVLRTMPTDSVESMLAECRKYKTPMILISQFVTQMDRSVVEAIFGTVSNFITFQCSLKDAKILSNEFGVFDERYLGDMPVGSLVVRMGRISDTCNAVVPQLEFPEEDYSAEILEYTRRRYCRSREEVDGILNRPNGVESGTQKQVNDSHNREISDDEAQFLEYITQNPELSLSKVGAALGFGGSRATRLRSRLKDRGYLLEFDTNQGEKGHRAKYGVITRPGMKAAGIKGRAGRGSPVHRHYAAQIRKFAETRGYRAAVEHPLPQGGAVDVHLEQNGLSIAAEISVTTSDEGEIRNITQALDAGYDLILCFLIEEERINKLQEKLSSQLSKEHLGKIRLAPITQFRNYL